MLTLPHSSKLAIGQLRSSYKAFNGSPRPHSRAGKRRRQRAARQFLPLNAGPGEPTKTKEL